MSEEATNPAPEETTDAAPETTDAAPEETTDAAPETVSESTPEKTDDAAPVAEAAPAVEPVAEAAAPVEEPAPAVPDASMMEKKSLPADAHGWWRGTGRRKAAVARVRIKPGEGTFMVNQRPMESFFNEERDRKNLVAVLEKTSMVGSVDIHAKVNGGGYTGQAGAIILGLGRALRNYDISLESTLRENGFLTRDPRKVERKKPGQPGARKKFQFSKR